MASASSSVMPSEHSTTKSSGTTKTGGVVSTTVMVWTNEVLLPASSVAVKVRVTV